MGPMATPFPVLLPTPRRVSPAGAGLALPPRVLLSAPRACLPEAARARLAAALERRGHALLAEGGGARATIVFEILASGGPEAYRLTIGPERALIQAGGPAGLSHGASTLAQLIDQAAPRLPGLVIEDEPAFARRGVMLDISRDRVPTMATLYELVELFAALKLNELQLYTEHTFAYAGHEEVWRDASPITPAELAELEHRARAHGIELVLNQNCFGHMHRWLKHARYRPLAEVPEGLRHPFSLEPEPFSLCPLDPRSLELVADLLDQLTACATSPEINVGLDETFDLGQGRSRVACAERGLGRVYLEHLLAVRRLVAARGRRMQAWGDILMSHPELVPEVPRDVTVLLWGYDAGHPFERQARLAAASGLPFCVCPGTSSWQSFGGRTGNMLANVAAAARAGRAAGARGLLVTDWGDRGHLQPLAASAAGFAHAAELAWSGADEPLAPDAGASRLAAQLDAHVFRDPARELASAALELGRVEEALQSGATNGTGPFFAIALAEEPLPSSRVLHLSPAAIERGRAVLSRARAGLARSQAAHGPTPAAGALWTAELAHAADLNDLGLTLAAARLAFDGQVPLEALPSPTREVLAKRFAAALADHARLWAARSRPGGRTDSARWLERVRARLDGL
jgi:hypothetical protein